MYICFFEDALEPTSIILIEHMVYPQGPRDWLGSNGTKGVGSVKVLGFLLLQRPHEARSFKTGRSFKKGKFFHLVLLLTLVYTHKQI